MLRTVDLMLQLRLAFGYALRELRLGLRSGFHGFRVFLICLVLGVAALAGIGSLSSALTEGLRANGEELLGGDAEFRLANHVLSRAELDWLAHRGTVSGVVEQRAMLRRVDGTRSSLIELKSVDDRYPLFGRVALSPARDLAQALAPNFQGVSGIVVDRLLLAELGLKLGDRAALGSTEVEIRAVLDRTPDMAGSAFALGAPALASLDTLHQAGLDRPGTLASHAWRVRLGEGGAKALIAAARAAFPDPAVQTRDAGDPAPAVRDFISHAAGFLDLVALSALVVGGIGIANAVSATIDGRRRSTAVMRCLGASVGLMRAAALFEILTMTALGIAVGCLAGASLPSLANVWFGADLPFHLEQAPHALPLLTAAVFGLLAALAFTLVPLASIGSVSAATLLRQVGSSNHGWPSPAWLASALMAALALETVLVATTPDRTLALWFSLGVIAVCLSLVLAGLGIRLLAARLPHLHSVPLRLAIRNLHRPGARVVACLTSMGLGLTVLVVLALVQGWLEQEAIQRVPAKAPAYFFIDIQPDQVAAFANRMHSLAGVHDFNEMPSLRTRIVAVNGVPTALAKVEPEARPALDSERGLTYSAALPAGSSVVAGKWWPADYQGPPLISLDQGLARNLHLGVGDTLTFDVAGREITATIANLRRIDWGSLGINFFTIFAPGTLEPAPQTHIATVRTDGIAVEAVLQRTVTNEFPNVSAIRVRDVLDRLTTLVRTLAMAIRAVAAAALAAGFAVLVGLVAAAERRHRRDAVLLKVLGATRSVLALSLAIEYGLLGLGAACTATVIGSVAARLWVTRFVHGVWQVQSAAVLAWISGVTLAASAVGVIGTMRALNAPPWAALRED